MAGPRPVSGVVYLGHRFCRFQHAPPAPGRRARQLGHVQRSLPGAAAVGSVGARTAAVSRAVGYAETVHRQADLQEDRVRARVARADTLRPDLPDGAHRVAGARAAPSSRPSTRQAEGCVVGVESGMGRRPAGLATLVPRGDIAGGCAAPQPRRRHLLATAPRAMLDGSGGARGHLSRCVRCAVQQCGHLNRWPARRAGHVATLTAAPGDGGEAMIDCIHCTAVATIWRRRIMLSTGHHARGHSHQEIFEAKRPAPLSL
eukprot:ctg_1322.g559